MKATKLLIIFGLIFLVCSGLVSADLTTDLINYYPFDYNATNIVGSNSGSVSGAILTSGLINDAYIFDGVNDRITFSSQLAPSSGSYSINLWIYARQTNEASFSDYIYFDRGSNMYQRIALKSNLLYLSKTDNSGNWQDITSSYTNISGWNMVSLLFNSTDSKIYGFINSENVGIIASGIHTSSVLSSLGCHATDNNYCYNGSIDEVGIWSRLLTDDELTELYNSGAGLQYPFTSPSPEENFAPYQSMFNDTNSNLIQLLTVNQWVPILADTITLNSGVYNYESTAIQTYSSVQDSNIECRFMINGVQQGATITRTNIAGETGSLIVSGSVNQSGELNMSVECRRTSGNVLTYISLAQGVGHVISNTTYYDSSVNNYLVNSVGQELDEFTLDFNSSGVIVLDVAGTIRSSVVDELSFWINSSDGQSCSPTIRGLNAGGSGSFAYNCLFQYNGSSPINISTYASGTSVNLTTSVQKKLIRQGNISGLTEMVLTTSPQVIGSVTLNNSDSISSVFIKSDISNLDNSGVDDDVLFSFWVDGVQVSTNFSYTSSEIIKNAIFHQVAPAVNGVFDVELKAWKQSTGNVSVQGGNLVAYVVNDYAITPQMFEVTAYNIWNLSSIQVFNVSVGGVIISTTNGLIDVVTGADLINLSVSSQGYFTEIVLNHPTNTSLNQSMKQSIINLSVVETFTGAPISDWSIVNGSTVLVNTSGSSGFFYPNPSTFSNVTLISNTGVFQPRALSNIVVAGLDNRTITFDILSTEFNITAINLVNSASINNFSITYVNLNRTHTSTTTTTDGEIILYVVDGDTYNITIDAIGYANFGNSILKTFSGSDDYQFSLYVTNTLNITFLDEDTGEVITEPVYINLIGDIISYNFNTSTGNVFEDLLNPQRYTIQYGSVGSNYSQRLYYLDVVNRSYNELTLYLTKINGSTITATVYDTTNNLLEGAVIRVLKFDSDTNSFLLSQMGETNFEGITQFDLIKFTTFYKFLIYYPDDELRFTSAKTYIYNDELVFFINIRDSYSQQYFEGTSIIGNLSYLSSSNNFKFEFSNSQGVSEDISLNVYTVENNVLTYYDSAGLTSASGIIYVPITPVNGTTFYAEAIVEIDGEEIILSVLTQSFLEDIPEKTYFLFIMFLLTLIFLFIDLTVIKNAIILTPVPLVMGSAIGIIPVSIYITISLWIAMFVLSVVIKK